MSGNPFYSYESFNDYGTRKPIDTLQVFADPSPSQAAKFLRALANELIPSTNQEMIPYATPLKHGKVLSHYCTNSGPWWYGKHPDGPFCENCWKIYFEKNKDKLTLSGQGGISGALQFKH